MRWVWSQQYLVILKRVDIQELNQPSSLSRSYTLWAQSKQPDAHPIWLKEPLFGSRFLWEQNIKWYSAQTQRLGEKSWVLVLNSETFQPWMFRLEMNERWNLSSLRFNQYYVITFLILHHFNRFSSDLYWPKKYKRENLILPFLFLSHGGGRFEMFY